MTTARNAVVVTGAHRSGTTLLGELVSLASGTWTVWEPFNRHWGLREVTTAYPYLTRTDAADPRVASLLRYLDTGRSRWAVKQGPSARPARALRSLAKTGGRYRLWRRNRTRVPVVKDPFVLLAMGALQPAVTASPIVVSVRHPCSWVLSLRRMSWPAGPELNALIAQDALYEEHLAGLLERRDWTRADDLDAGATAWACLYHLVDVQVRDGVQALVVPLESFGREPVGTMRRIYQATSLPAPPDVERLAQRYSGLDPTVTPQAGRKHVLQRNSRALNDAWRSGLSAREIGRVREVTEPVFATIYADWDTAEERPRDPGR